MHQWDFRAQAKIDFRIYDHKIGFPKYSDKSHAIYLGAQAQQNSLKLSLNGINYS